MKVVTKLDLGHNFNSHFQVRIDDLTASHTARAVSTCPQENINERNKTLIDSIRQIAKDAYSLGVEQGIQQERSIVSE